MRWMTVIVGLLIVGAANPEPKREGRTRAEWREWLKGERKTQIERLRAYREAGAFPRAFDEMAPIGKDDPHFDAENPRVHQFKDADGVLCALASLIAKSGGREIVDRIARDDNHFCVGVGKDASVTAWILRSGLTLEDCVSIQEPGFILDDIDQITRLRKRLDDVARDLDKKADARLDVALDRLWEKLGS